MPAQQQVGQGGDVGNGGLAVSIHIAGAGAFLPQHHVDERRDIGNADFPVGIYVANLCKVGHDIGEIFPLVSSLVCTQILGQHMQGPVFRNSIENITPYADFFRVRICVYPCQAFATGESIVADGGDGIGDGDAGQAAAFRERPFTDGGDGVGDGDTGQAGATLERPVADGGDGAWDGDARQAGAITERIVTYLSDGVGDGDARQAGAYIERPVADGGDGVGDDSIHTPLD